MNSTAVKDLRSAKTHVKELMIVELYVCEGQLKSTKGKVICSMVASAPPTHLSFHNTVLISPGGVTKIEGEKIPTYALAVAYDLIKIIEVYAQMNRNTFPEQIVIYRDGDEVDEGHRQLEHIFQRELPQIRSALDMFYKEKQLSPVEFAFVAVSRNTNENDFNITQGETDSPPANFGTASDGIVTLPAERYDFYLTSKTARGHEHVRPIGFNILYDNSHLSPDQLQGLTLKMCHSSFNCLNDETENLEDAAICQYARTLANQNQVAVEDPSKIDVPYL